MNGIPPIKMTPISIGKRGSRNMRKHNRRRGKITSLNLGTLEELPRPPLAVPVPDLLKSEAGKQLLRSRGYRGSKVHNTMTRPFVAWDGEGVDNPDGTHNYVLFGSSTGHYIQGEELRTVDYLDTLLRCEFDNPDAIHVGFAFGYDSEMILRDLPEIALRQLFLHNWIYWGRYRIEYIRGKYFQVGARFAGRNLSIRVWDIFSFFHVSFVAAVKDYLGDVPGMAEIEKGKRARGTFTYDQVEGFVKPYWQSELSITVQLADKLRDLLHQADIRLTRWHGPGALVSYMFREEKSPATHVAGPAPAGDGHGAIRIRGRTNGTIQTRKSACAGIQIRYQQCLR